MDHGGGLTKTLRSGAARELGIMKQKLIGLSRRYASALRRHLQQGPRANLDQARGLGRQAVTLGLETLDVARIHQGALADLEASASRDGIIKGAEMFFIEAVTPIERPHRAALKGHARLRQVNKRLDRHTADLAASHRSLKKSIVRRKEVEEALRKSGGHSQKLLKKAHRLQNRLRELTHRILMEQEDSMSELPQTR